MAAHKPTREAPSSRWPLLQVGYAKSTAQKYNGAVRDFHRWCKTTGEQPVTVEELDEVLADYFHVIFEEKEGKGKQKARDTLWSVRKHGFSR